MRHTFFRVFLSVEAVFLAVLVLGFVPDVRADIQLQECSIVIGEVLGGAVTAPSAATCGETVTLAATTSTAGYAPVITVCKTGDPSVTVAVTYADAGQYAFTMPNFAVTVSATFGYLYRYAVYNTDGDPASGIREWRAELANAVPIVAQTELSAGWYVVNADTTISSRITCSGDVHLILADGFTLTASSGITVADGTATLTIYGQEAGTGTLLAQASSQGSGIGGFSTGSSSTYVNGGAITINGGTVTATGGNYAAGIGGGAYSGWWRTYVGGTGDGITVNGGTVTATGGNQAAGIGGGGAGGSGENITINGGTITASSGIAKAWGVGYGYTTSTATGQGIYADPYVTVEARSSTSGSWKEITHASESVDLSNNSSFRVRYVQTTPPARHAVALAPCEYGTASTRTAKAAPGETVTLALTVEEGSAFLAVRAYKTGEETTEVELTTVTEGVRYSFAMPDYDVTVQADFKTPTATEPMASVPTEVAHTTFKVYTNSVLSADGIVWSNRTATVVYTAADGYVFPDGAAALTNQLDTTVSPAVNMVEPEVPFDPDDLLKLGEFNFGSMTFPRADGLAIGSYRQLTVMFTREMSGESLDLPAVEGYALNDALSTEYSYVIDIDAPGKTAAEIAQYIRQIVFSNCRNQRLRISLAAEGTVYRTFHFGGNGHYYQYVPFATHNEFSWTACYEKASKMIYMGRQGYLATVMSQAEDVFIYKASADPSTGKGQVGWLGGTSSAHGDADGDMYYKSFDATALDQEQSGIGHWYWACGPERGQEFFDWAQNGTSCTTEIYTRNAEENNYYFNWDSLGAAYNAQREPNGYNQSGDYERFLTTLGFGYGYNTDSSSTTPGSKLGSDVYGWNDLKLDGNVGLAEKWDVLGYVVEFGDQLNGDTKDGRYVAGYAMVETDIRAPIVTYDASEGEFAGGEKTNAVTILNAGGGYVLPTAAPTYADHHLAGWYTNLEDKTSLVMAGSPLLSKIDHTVYAKWAEGSYTSVKVAVEGGGKIDVSLPENELEERGGDPEAVEENGNRTWENIVMGLEPNGHVATGARQNENEHTINAVAANMGVPPADTGVAIGYRLDHVSRNGLMRGEEESRADSPTGLFINLDRIETNEYFKVRIVLLQTNNVGDVLLNKEFVATNTLGVLNVSTAPQKTIVSVPWGELGFGDAEVKVADLVKTANLTPGDRLYAYRMDEGRYDAWELGDDRTWKAATVAQLDAVGGVQVGATGNAAGETIPRGSACWLERQDNTRPFYLYGQVETNATVRSTAKANASGKSCWNLIGSPHVTALDLNEQFTDASHEGDRIIVPTDGAPKNYTYKGGQWGYYVTEPYKNGVRAVFKTDDTKVPPGLGIWYINNGKTDKVLVW